MNFLGTISEILLERNIIYHQNNFTSKEYMLKKKNSSIFLRMK